MKSRADFLLLFLEGTLPPINQRILMSAAEFYKGRGVEVGQKVVGGKRVYFSKLSVDTLYAQRNRNS